MLEQATGQDDYKGWDGGLVLLTIRGCEWAQENTESTAAPSERSRDDTREKEEGEVVPFQRPNTSPFELFE